MTSLFAIGVGGSGAKCIEALTHLHAVGLLTDQRGQPVELHTFLVEPDEQSTLLARAERAIKLYSDMQQRLANRTQTFAKAQIRHYGNWNPLATANGAITLDQVFPKFVISRQAPELAALFDCLFHPDEQTADLGVGFRGRPPIGSTVMARVDLHSLQDQGQWQQLLAAIKGAAGRGDFSTVHLFGSVFGGTGASGVPTLGKKIKEWLVVQQIKKADVSVNASLLLPYFDFEESGELDVGLHAEASSFVLNTDAALRYLGTSGQECFDRTYLVGSDAKTRYEFSIGGKEQENAAHLVELLATLGACHGLNDMASQTSSCDAYVLSRQHPTIVAWEDIPRSSAVGAELARATRFSLAWLNNISLDLKEAQEMPLNQFVKGAPWSTQFFSLREVDKPGDDGRPNIRDRSELEIKKSIDDYTESLLQWLRQFTSNPGNGFSQQLLKNSELNRRDTHQSTLEGVVIGAARPLRDDSGRQDTVEDIKFKIDSRRKGQIVNPGVPGLADTLWSLSA
jgi:hypothetical protein